MVEQAQPAGRRTAPGAWFVLAPAIALVIGLVIGGLVVWAGQDDDSDVAASGDASPKPTPSASAAAGEPATSIVVPQECLQAADTVEESTEVFRDLVGAFGDFRGEELRDLLTRLEILVAQARSQADACRSVDVDGTAVPSPTSS